MDKLENISDLADLHLAQAVQEALLNCHIPDCRQGHIVVRNRMCTEVGGDFYHFYQLNPDQIAFAIGDVIGHGTSAALIMSLILGWLRNDQENYSRPGRIVNNINNLLVHLGEQVNYPITCSMIYGVVDLPSGILFYINAGHPHPIICNREICSPYRLGPTTMLLGVQHGVLGESCHQFFTGDRLILFSDGLIDVPNLQNEPFGQKRLFQTISESSEMGSEDLARELFQKIDTFRQNAPLQDDQTLVMIDFEQVKTEK